MTSSPITASAVNSRNKPSCVSRQKTRLMSAFSVANHDAAVRWCACPSYVSATQTLMSGKSDVIDPGVVEGHRSWSLGPHNRQRDRDSPLSPFGLQDLLDAAQDERPRRTPFARRPRLQLTIHAVGDVNGR